MVMEIPRQNVLATAVIGCERFLAELDGRNRDYVSPQSRQVLDEVPAAAVWARSFSSGPRMSQQAFRAQTAPRILNIALGGWCSTGVLRAVVINSVPLSESQGWL